MWRGLSFCSDHIYTNICTDSKIVLLQKCENRLLILISRPDKANYWTTTVQSFYVRCKVGLTGKLPHNSLFCSYYFYSFVLFIFHKHLLPLFRFSYNSPSVSCSRGARQVPSIPPPGPRGLRHESACMPSLWLNAINWCGPPPPSQSIYN